MLERINDKIIQIETFTGELFSMIPEDFNNYKIDFKTKAACERYFERIIEAVVDLAFLMIRYKKLKMPEDDESSFMSIN